MSGEWLKAAIVGGSKGCICCGQMHQTLPLDAVIAVGFGSAGYSKDGVTVWEEGHRDFNECHQVSDAEALAAKDPDHDWRIFFYAPLYESVYQRHGENHWVLIEKGQGFA